MIYLKMLALSTVMYPVKFLVYGFVLSKVWNWYIMPHVELGAVTVSMGFGAMVVAELLLNVREKPSSNDGTLSDVLEDLSDTFTPLLGSATALSVAIPLCILVIAWIVKFFI